MTNVAVSTAPGLSVSTHKVRTVDLLGPAGRLEAVLNEGSPAAPFSAVVCHPHPLGGGTLHNKVVYHAMKVLNATLWGFSFPVLRFNFRGVGLSQGVHHGTAESGDVEAAINWLVNAYKLPVIVVGFSFGAAMALHAACSPGGEGNSPLRALVALGLPIQADGRDYNYSFLKDCSIPKLFLSGERDQYATVASLIQVVAEVPEPKRLVFVPAADHFFSGQLQPMQHALATWLKEQIQ